MDKNQNSILNEAISIFPFRVFKNTIVVRSDTFTSIDIYMNEILKI